MEVVGVVGWGVSECIFRSMCTIVAKVRIRNVKRRKEKLLLRDGFVLAR